MSVKNEIAFQSKVNDLQMLHLVMRVWPFYLTLTQQPSLISELHIGILKMFAHTKSEVSSSMPSKIKEQSVRKTGKIVHITIAAFPG